MLRLSRLLPLLPAVVAALAVASPAPAATPCWKLLIIDWYDGRIDQVYPVSCYRQALAHMPEDADVYTTLREDINRALAAVIAGKDPRGPGSGSRGTSGKSTFRGGPGSKPGGTVSSGGRDANAGGPLGNAIGSLGSNSADSVPVPLLVLGGLAIALLALGSAGFLARRLQARKATVRSTTKP